MDPRQLLQEGRFDELAHEDDQPFWRGLALLELNRPGEAARVFEEMEGASQTATLLAFAGAGRWLSGEKTLAVERWIAALDAEHEGPSAAIRPPALLVYAGTRLGDGRFVARGKRLLGKLYTPKRKGIWPGPVAGYLLDLLPESDFLEQGYSDEELEARRFCAANFWAGVKCDDPEQAKARFRKSAEAQGAAVLEVEHHLARGEL